MFYKKHVLKMCLLLPLSFVSNVAAKGGDLLARSLLRDAAMRGAVRCLELCNMILPHSNEKASDEASDDAALAWSALTAAVGRS